LKAFGEIVRYPERLEAVSAEKQVTVLAGENEQGEKALLISAFGTGAREYHLKTDSELTPENCEILLLDNSHFLTDVKAEVVFNGKETVFRSDSNSACILIRLHR